MMLEASTLENEGCAPHWVPLRQYRCRFSDFGR